MQARPTSHDKFDWRVLFADWLWWYRFVSEERHFIYDFFTAQLLLRDLEKIFIGWLPQGEEEVFRLSGKIASLFHFALHLALLGLLHSPTGNMAFQERNLFCSTAQAEGWTSTARLSCQVTRSVSDSEWTRNQSHRCWKNFLFEATVWKGLPLLSPGLCSTINPDEIWVISMYLHLGNSFKNSKVAVLSSICTTLIVTLMACISAS